MLDNLVRANGQILADYILAGLDTNPDTIDNRTFDERLRNYGRGLTPSQNF